MANKNKNNTQKTGGFGLFWFAGIALLVASAAFMLVLFNSFNTTTEVYDDAISVIEDFASINNDLLKVNTNLLSLISASNIDTYDPSDYTQDINKGFARIDKSMAAAEENSRSWSERQNRRYNQAKSFINAYHDRINNLISSYDPSKVYNTYVQELQPLQVAATEMFSATIDIAEMDTKDEVANVRRSFWIAEGVLGGIAIIGEIAIIIAARITKRNREELARRQAEVEAATQKFKHTKEKASEMAYRNILLDMKNRYALEEDIGGRLETDQFNIAVFDMDNFRSINDMYGYGFGDEYLATIAERLKSEFGSDAEIYNITGSEFCFVFNREISDIQAARISQQVVQVLGDWYTVLNLNVQLTASGSTYHYLPGDCMDVNALLVKLDNVLRDAKRNGGNMVLQVVGI